MFILHAILVTALGVSIIGCAAGELNINFHQDDYDLKFQRLELLRFNKDLVKEVSVVTFKYNRTTAVANATFTFLRAFGNDMSAIIQAYKFMSNEYRTFPARFAVGVCKALAVNTFGIHEFLACGNYTGCPMSKGKYHFCNWSPDQSKFPPFVPSGEYKMAVQLLHFSDEIAVVDCYVTISRPIAYT